MDFVVLYRYFVFFFTVTDLWRSGLIELNLIELVYVCLDIDGNGRCVHIFEGQMATVGYA